VAERKLNMCVCRHTPGGHRAICQELHIPGTPRTEPDAGFPITLTDGNDPILLMMTVSPHGGVCGFEFDYSYAIHLTCLSQQLS